MRYLLLVLTLGAVPAAAQTAAVPAGPAPAPSQRNADYVLGPQDTVKVTVFDEAALTGSFRIDADGSFSYPLLDRIKAAGRTTVHIKDEIQKRLADGFVQRPQVTVEVDSFRTRNVSVVGEVRSPGRLTLVGQMTVLEALAQAGYMTASAGSDIQVLHQPENGALRGETTRIAVSDLQANKPEANIVLKEGDLIIVDKAQKVTVSGLVRTPNQYTWERGLIVRVAIALAGGVTEKGSTRGIIVHRVIDGKPTRKNVGLDDAVEPNDIIEVRQRRL